MAALRAMYRARDADAGLKALEDFDTSPWVQRYPAIAQSWRRNWSQIALHAVSAFDMREKLVLELDPQK